jgi:hypothetical protein
MEVWRTTGAAELMIQKMVDMSEIFEEARLVLISVS